MATKKTTTPFGFFSTPAVQSNLFGTAPNTAAAATATSALANAAPTASVAPSPFTAGLSAAPTNFGLFSATPSSQWNFGTTPTSTATTTSAVAPAAPTAASATVAPFAFGTGLSTPAKALGSFSTTPSAQWNFGTTPNTGATVATTTSAVAPTAAPSTLTVGLSTAAKNFGLFSTAPPTMQSNLFGTTPTTTVAIAITTSAMPPIAPIVQSAAAPAGLSTAGTMFSLSNATPSVQSSLFGTTPTSVATAPSAMPTVAPTASFTVAPSSSLAPPGLSTAAAKTFGLFSTTPSTVQSSSLFGTTPTTVAIATTTSVATGAAPTAAAALTVASASTALTSGLSTAVTAPAMPKPLNYDQLENDINSWVTDVQEHERIFLSQAAQINSWDRILMENGDKILELNDGVENLQTQQLKVDHELDFIYQQQRELDQLLEQLEKNLYGADETYGPEGVTFHGDAQREQMMQQQVLLDSQLKQMGQDLNQIQERLSALTEKDSQDSTFGQIVELLGKQMDALQWINEQTSSMQIKTDDMKQELASGRFQNSSVLSSSRFSAF